MNVFALVQRLSGAAVVGGYPRDVALGGITKDVDVAVFGEQRAAAAERLVEWLAEIGYTLVQCHSGEYNGGEVDLYDCIYQLEHPDGIHYAVDILVFAEAGNLQECLDTFDYNMNKWYLGMSGPVWSGENFGSLMPSGKPRTQERASKMVAKARAYGWVV